MITSAMDIWDHDEPQERRDAHLNLTKGVRNINDLYQQELKKALRGVTGTQYTSDLKFCAYSHSEGIKDCPISQSREANEWGHKEFIVIVHNPSMYNQSLVRVKLDKDDYKAKIWSREFLKFEDQDTDIVE